MSNQIKKTRSIDIVICMDGTGSMSPCIRSVKNNAKRFYSDFVSAMTDLGSDIEMLRIKTIVFRDYKSDSDAMEESAFFELPGEQSAFEAHLDTITAHGGCGQDANGLEALYKAMCSDFVTGPNDRQVIVMFADTTALSLLRRKNCEGYPDDMVDMNGLQETWMCLQGGRAPKLRERCKRLAMFAPKGTVYEEIAQNFNRSVYTPVEMNSGMDEVSFDDIIKILAASASC